MADQKKKEKGEIATTTISAVTQANEFRKTNEVIGIRISQGRLSLLPRKIFNVFVYAAQQSGIPGKFVPNKDEINKNYFWISMRDLAKFASYNSNDYKLLKEQIQELQDVRIVVEDEKSWISERLISSVKLLNDKGLESRRGQTWVGFTFPPELHRRIMDADTSYTRLSLYYQAQIKSGPTLSLYEITKRYLTNPSKKTRVESWEWWYEMLTGLPISTRKAEYRYFKRDTVLPAIAEINTVTDVHVELIEFKQGRRVQALQFEVRPSENNVIDSSFIGDQQEDIVRRLVQLGASPEDADRLYAAEDESSLLSVLEFVEKRVKNSSMERVAVPIAYLKSLLKKGYQKKVPVKIFDQKTVSSRKQEFSLKERFLARRSAEAWDFFQELEEDQKQNVFEEFCLEKKPRVRKMDKALSSKLTQVAFSKWFAEKNWGEEPTQEELLKFAEENWNMKE